MQRKVIEHSGVRLIYWQKGGDPKLLVAAGTHGDEYGVIKHVHAYLLAHEAKLPDFVWIPMVSPSAVRRKTRKNVRNLDVNRMFHDDRKDMEPEVLVNLALAEGGGFSHFISFHEDYNPLYKFSNFYVYDTGDRNHSEELRLFREAARRALDGSGISLLTGYDDTHDPDLWNFVKEGYFSEQWPSGAFGRNRFVGEAHSYFVHKGMASLGLNPEIPQNASPEVKAKLVAIIFEHCLKWKDAR